VDPGKAIHGGQTQQLALVILQGAGVRLHALLQQDAGGDVLLDPQKMRQPALPVEDRRHTEFVPEQRAVLAEIAQYHQAGFAPGDGIADHRPVGLIPFLTLEKPAIAVHDLFLAVAGEALEGGIDEDQRTVGKAGIGDGDAVAGVHDGLFEEFDIDHDGLLRGCGAAPQSQQRCLSKPGFW